jgi:hypothetical protein
VVDKGEAPAKRGARGTLRPAAQGKPADRDRAEHEKRHGDSDPQSEANS